jgi:MoaA/NifB/PqqE/SkfB family radical SAM enzyme
LYQLKHKLHERQRQYKLGALRTVAIDVTSKCNMSCPHCYADTFMNKDMVELSVLKGAIDELHEMGAFHYVLQGGEAIIDTERLDFIVNSCRPDESYINVVSNGWDMSVENIEHLKQIGVDKISFSLDSGIKEEHDASRKEGSYSKIMKAIDDVLRVGLFTSISTVITRDGTNSDGFKQIIKYAENKDIRIDIQIAMPVGKWDGETSNLAGIEDIKTIKEMQSSLGKLNNGQNKIHRDLYCADGDYCPAATSFMALTATGEILTCNFLQFSLGNIRDVSIKSARDRIQASEWFNGGKKTCICGEDMEFIEKFIVANKHKAKPLSAWEVFGV